MDCSLRDHWHKYFLHLVCFRRNLLLDSCWCADRSQHLLLRPRSTLVLFTVTVLTSQRLLSSVSQAWLFFICRRPAARDERTSAYVFMTSGCTMLPPDVVLATSGRFADVAGHAPPISCCIAVSVGSANLWPGYIVVATVSFYIETLVGVDISAQDFHAAIFQAVC